MSGSKRRFEFVEGTSDKFWEIEQKANEITVRFGRNGTNGQSEQKTFADEAAATKHAEARIAGKVKKGYIEVK